MRVSSELLQTGLSIIVFIIIRDKFIKKKRRRKRKKVEFINMIAHAIV